MALSKALNEALTQVGSGTPMGDMMRRYWQPVAATAELDDHATKEVTILGEDLVLYKDRSGNLGLIDRFCPHRRVNMAYGIPETDGLRCPYHGWKFNDKGQCTEQPFEDTVRPEGRFKEKCGIAGYPVQEMGGLIFAYLGPAPTPYLPRWEPLEWENAVRDIAISVLPCNWLQCQENSLDPVHVEWLHAYYGMWLQSQRQELLSRALAEQHHMDIGFDVFEHGIIKRRVLKGYTQEDDDWKYGHPILFPNILLVGNQMNSTLQFRVPMDDTHTYHISYYAWQPAPGSEVPRRQERVPYRYVPLKDDQGGYVTNVLFNQDYMAWMTQGEIADRTLEKLGESDRGIILFRKMLQEQMAIAEDGGDPMNVFRSEEAARNVHIGIEQVKFGDKKLFARYFPGEAGYSTDAELVDEVLATWDKVLTEV